jgi:hypothetical protein
MTTKYNINDKVWIPVIYDKRNETYIVVNIYDDKTNDQEIKLVEAKCFNIDEVYINPKKTTYINHYYRIFENEQAEKLSDIRTIAGINQGFENIFFTEDIMFDTEEAAKKEIGKAIFKIIGPELGCFCCNCK